MTGRDAVRAALAAVMPAHQSWCHAEAHADCCRADDCDCGVVDSLDALLPVVDRIAKERAADEIRAIAHRLDDGGDEAIEVALGGAHYVHRVLCDTAHALDGKP